MQQTKPFIDKTSTLDHTSITPIHNKDQTSGILLLARKFEKPEKDYFLKPCNKLDSPEHTLNNMIASTLYRFYLGNAQPKCRLAYLDLNGELHCCTMIERIVGWRDLKETRTATDGLGAIILTSRYLGEWDPKSSNYGENKNGTAVKIDHDWTFHSIFNRDEDQTSRLDKSDILNILSPPNFYFYYNHQHRRFLSENFYYFNQLTIKNKKNFLHHLFYTALKICITPATLETIIAKKYKRLYVKSYLDTFRSWHQSNETIDETKYSSQANYFHDQIKSHEKNHLRLFFNKEKKDQFWKEMITSDEFMQWLKSFAPFFIDAYRQDNEQFIRKNQQFKKAAIALQPEAIHQFYCRIKDFNLTLSSTCQRYNFFHSSQFSTIEIELNQHENIYIHLDKNLVLALLHQWKNRTIQIDQLFFITSLHVLFFLNKKPINVNQKKNLIKHARQLIHYFFKDKYASFHYVCFLQLASVCLNLINSTKHQPCHNKTLYSIFSFSYQASDLVCKTIAKHNEIVSSHTVITTRKQKYRPPPFYRRLYI